MLIGLKKEPEKKEIRGISHLFFQFHYKLFISATGSWNLQTRFDWLGIWGEGVGYCIPELQGSLWHWLPQDFYGQTDCLCAGWKDREVG